jgi:hypothetical protein
LLCLRSLLRLIGGFRQSRLTLPFRSSEYHVDIEVLD